MKQFDVKMYGAKRCITVFSLCETLDDFLADMSSPGLKQVVTFGGTVVAINPWYIEAVSGPNKPWGNMIYD